MTAKAAGGGVASDLAVCTIVLRAQLPRARVLAASLKRHHAGCDLSVLVLDGTAPADGNFQPLTLEAAGLSAEEARQLPMLASADELTALAKPHLLATLLASSKGPIVFLDPSTELFAPLTPLEALVAEHAVVTTPAVKWIPPQSDRWSPPAVELDPALIAVSKDAHGFLESWIDSARLTAGLRARNSNPARPALPEPFILDDAAWDLGFWNLEGPRLTQEADRYAVNGQPLRLFRFEGYEPEKPHLLSALQGTHPRILLSDNHALLQLCEQYRHKLLECGHDPDAAPSGLEVLPSGLKIDAHMRGIYREALRRFQTGSGPEPPSPFGSGGERAFLGWINESVALSHSSVVTRYMLAVHAARADVRDAFPDPWDDDASAFWHWYTTFGRAELQIPDALLPSDYVPVATASSDIAHVNVAGYFRAELGVGEAARLLLAAFQEAAIPFNTVSYDRTANRQEHPFSDAQVGTVSDINVVCVNAAELPAFAEQMGPDFFNGRYTIGVWFWEVDEFPQALHAAFNYVDEIWVASEFVRRALLKVSPKPVVKIELPIAIPERLPQPAVTKLPNGFVFLFSFDFLSVLERKNPAGLIEAFKRAFRPEEGAVLVLKTINGDQRVREMEKVRFAAHGRPDIHLSDGYLSATEKQGLVELCDCYISLHRSEGFGLTMAEAMAIGKPVIATAYSGNLEFMTAQNSYLCGFVEREVGAECEPYPPSAHWADPDLDHAASLMRQVFEDRVEAAARGRGAAEDIARHHSPATAGAFVQQRIARIRERRARGDNPGAIRLIEERLDALEAAYRKLSDRLRAAPVQPADAMPSRHER